MNDKFTEEFPKGLLTLSEREQAVNITLLLSANELEQVKSVLISSRKKAVAYLNRTKRSFKRINRSIDINNIDMSLYKAEHCKPRNVYPLKLLSSEIETLIHCLECSEKKKSKHIQQMIDMLYAVSE